MRNGVVLAGLPATGKTSYLALLFYAIVDGRADGLNLGRFDDDREYITEISDVLLATSVADHTTLTNEQDVTLSLAYNDMDFVLNIPDLSGETWEHALVDRRWSLGLNESIANATGFIVFVHCKDINSGLTIVDAKQAAAILGDDDAPIDQTGIGVDDRRGEAAGTSASQADTHDERAPDPDDIDEEEDEEKHCKQLTQVSLIELIQFFIGASPAPIRVSLIISAWDLEPKTLEPNRWLSKNMPMLAQFLAVNTEQVEAAVWGVSAQGADFSDDQIREEYKDKDPIDRAQICAADGAAVGVAAPLLWALNLDQ